MVQKLGLICVNQGDDWAGQVTVNNCDGTPMDLTGYTVHAQMRSGPADQTWRIAACFTTAILLPNVITISLTHRQTTCLRNPQYVWSMEIVSPDGIVTTVVAGQVNVTPQVTREPRRWMRNEIDAFIEVWYPDLPLAAHAADEEFWWLQQA